MTRTTASPSSPLRVAPLAWAVCVAALLQCAAAFAADSLTVPDTLIDPADTSVLISASNGGAAEGPSVGPDGTVYYTELGMGAVFWVAPDGSSGTFAGADKPNGTAIDALGRLNVCDRGRLWRTEIPGRAVTVMLLPGMGNDIALMPDGGIYVTVPVWDGVGQVTYLSPQGVTIAVLDSVPYFPNGIEYVAERNALYITFTQSGEIRRYGIAGDGALVDSGLAVAAASPDGMTLDNWGNLWVANFSSGQIDVYSPNGDTIGFVDNPAFGSSVQNCCFGGDTSHTLFIAAAAGIFRIRTQVTGRDTRGGIVSIHPKRAQQKAPSGATTGKAIRSGTYRADGKRLPDAAAQKPGPRDQVAQPRVR